MRTPLADPNLTLEPGSDGGRVRDHDGALHYLNQTAAVVWALADGTRSVATIADEVAALFDLSEPPIKDVERILDDMAAKGLITP